MIQLVKIEIIIKNNLKILNHILMVLDQLSV